MLGRFWPYKLFRPRHPHALRANALRCSHFRSVPLALSPSFTPPPPDACSLVASRITPAPPLPHRQTHQHYMRFLDLSLIFCYYIRTVKERLREAQPTDRRDPMKTIALTFQPAAYQTDPDVGIYRVSDADLTALQQLSDSGKPLVLFSKLYERIVNGLQPYPTFPMTIDAVLGVWYVD